MDIWQGVANYALPKASFTNFVSSSDKFSPFSCLVNTLVVRSTCTHLSIKQQVLRGWQNIRNINQPIPQKQHQALFCHILQYASFCRLFSGRAKQNASHLTPAKLQSLQKEG